MLRYRSHWRQLHMSGGCGDGPMHVVL